MVLLACLCEYMMTKTENSTVNASHDAMANAIRALAMDAVQKANSGHPGMPMGIADVATVLFSKFLKFCPGQPDWPDRDRFVLSAGHGSMLIYALNHLLGYKDMPIEEVKNFRQLGSKTPGHPEFGHTLGVETTTGPLGQGLGNAVGMALAEAMLAARFGKNIVDHHTYAIVGDGCLMEGISQESIALAGHLKLNKLVVLWDDNGISIDGPVSLSDSVDQLRRFESAGWNTTRVDGHDAQAITSAIQAAHRSDRPTFIACKTIIGFGSPSKQGTSGVHGSPLGADEIVKVRETLNWPHTPFEIPSDTLDAWRLAGLRSSNARKAWEERHEQLPAEQKAEFDRRIAGTLPSGIDEAIAAFKKKLVTDKPNWATRKSSEEVLNVLAPVTPELLGGSADLTGSNNTKAKSQKAVTPDDYSGDFIHYGIREHGMAAAMNGIALHRGFIPYSGTFLVFSDYCRPSIRLSALMEQRVIYVLTHDSIGLGEDGPTHQPVEHLAALRLIPNLQVFRPADAVETLECWEIALKSEKTPSVLALSRQNLAAIRLENSDSNLCARGAYEVAPSSGTSAVTLIGTGSEVQVALDARRILEQEGIATRVVSMPSMELFEKQSEAFKQEILGGDTVRVVVEAAVRFGWDRYLGSRGEFVGMTGFGASAPAPELYKHFGITAEAVAAAAKKRLG